ncbi:MBL fold metallo-hydrolase [Aquimarina sp. I32.4]|uniref:MBL fold metallo-hydrolase n=1 Tax=Aquimarina sp. I32.4 TaxID=2053903 RepID=UPI001304931B
MIYNENIGILVDPAWDYDLINEFLLVNRITLKAILLTHSHIDHTNLAEKFALVRKIPVFISGEEIDAYGFTCLNLRKVKHLNKIILGNIEVMPIITPGHTLGSTCYLIENNLFSGDTVFIEGVGTCNRSDAYKLYNSVQFLKNYLVETTSFWPGHSFGKSAGQDLNYLMKHNIYFQFRNVEHFVDFRTRKNRPDPLTFK